MPEKVEESEKKVSVEDLFENLFKMFPPYLDYYESDLGMYLTNKIVKKFPIFTFFRILIIFGMITSFIFYIFTRTDIFLLIFVILGLLFFIYEKIWKKKYNLTFYFLQERNKKFKIFRDQLVLFSNNAYLANDYKTSSFNYDLVKTKLEKLKNRIENDVKITRSYTYYLINFGPIILALLFAPFLELVFIILPEIFVSIDLDLIFRISFNLILSLPLIIIWFRGIKNRLKARGEKEKSVYFIYEAAIFAFLELTRQVLRSLEFPEDGEILKTLIKSIK